MPEVRAGRRLRARSQQDELRAPLERVEDRVADRVLASSGRRRPRSACSRDAGRSQSRDAPLLTYFSSTESVVAAVVAPRAQAPSQRSDGAGVTRRLPQHRPRAAPGEIRRAEPAAAAALPERRAWGAQDCPRGRRTPRHARPATASRSSTRRTFAPRSPRTARRGGPPACYPNRPATGTGSPRSATPNSSSCAPPSPTNANSSTSSGEPATAQPPTCTRSATRSARSPPPAPGTAAQPSRHCAPAVSSTLRPSAQQSSRRHPKPTTSVVRAWISPISPAISPTAACGARPLPCRRLKALQGGSRARSPRARKASPLLSLRNANSLTRRPALGPPTRPLPHPVEDRRNESRHLSARDGPPARHAQRRLPRPTPAAARDPRGPSGDRAPNSATA